MQRGTLALGFLMVFVNYLHGQGLEDIPPVLKTTTEVKPATAREFILSTTDFKQWANEKGVKNYANSAQIVDADEPWPPRWFISAPLRNWDTINWQAEGLTRVEDLVMDARYQSGYITFFKERSTTYKTHKDIDEGHYIICNANLQPVDTFETPGHTINYHDFRINANGEKMVMMVLDTVLNIAKMSGDARDTAVKAIVDVIEIFDKKNKLLFRWNPVATLGVNAFYYPYRSIMSVSSKPGYLDWSHGNSLGWDYDGNILYGFRHIGIGKISRADGKIIWRMDRNRMPYIEKGVDNIAFYLQHAFDKNSDSGKYVTYTVFSNGDAEHPISCALIFKVNKNTNAVHFVRRKEIVRVKDMAQRHGNYEIAGNGDYVLNYGQYTCDSAAYRLFLEYGDSANKVYCLYSTPNTVSSYKVHIIEHWQPPRPTISAKAGTLTATGNMNDWTWYQLSGKNNDLVKQVGKGVSYTPNTAGVYCVAGKYGIGYAVSKAFISK